ncbi:S-adenosyl-L-methionine-dependent methyltransferase [Pseudomassariella vexata]|uniref:S-adenosyl-L-methionine-dependent methyltransferase n=1 Tax=Pseudomassariella vexata TaxID=1141098 RepID=A0A1Y2E0W1_9PEZI|nr:S-adenosyl-L-methionine-dependent methyltransferase [Pseudomassariella vexata]ORY65117.1 S-adenosyl-L-methionine-dependent methyltransferase [Pseudomassariella vexata]
MYVSGRQFVAALSSSSPRHLLFVFTLSKNLLATVTSAPIMADFAQVKKEYDNQATIYNDYDYIPHGILESQLLASALGDCTGLYVLDLGGGTGLRARQALDAGAATIDVVDISPEMLRIGKSIEASLNGLDRVRWLEADVSKPLDHLPLREYDLVMANWVFDHASSVAELEGMWRNVVSYLRPGGRFVGVRSGDPQAPGITSGKYGTTYKDHEEIPGGLKFRYVLSTDPPIEFEATSMEVSYSGSTEMHQRFGLVDIEVEPYENAEIIRRDPEFWGLFLEMPSMVVVKARKIAEG